MSCPDEQTSNVERNECFFDNEYFTIKSEIINIPSELSNLNGYTTYRIKAVLKADARNIYALAGTPESNLLIPPSFREGGTFSSGTGGVSQQFLAMGRPELRYDSWITLSDQPNGILVPGTTNASPGFGDLLDVWSSREPTQNINDNNSAFFWMNPELGPTGENGDIMLAQLTIRDDLQGQERKFTGVLNGRLVDDVITEDMRASGDTTWSEIFSFTIPCPSDDGSYISGQDGCSVSPSVGTEPGVQCSDGYQRNDADECVECPVGTAGMGGNCFQCGDGQQPNTLKTACEVCPPTMVGMDGTCSQCPSGQQPNRIITECEVCPPRMAGMNGTCEQCPHGQQPDGNSEVCEDCPDGSTGTDGSCSQCPPGTAGTGGTCSQCTDGQQPHENSDVCEYTKPG